MQVLRDRVEQVDTLERARRLARLAAEGDAHTLLIELGMLEQGAIDDARAQADDLGELERAFADAQRFAGEACLFDHETSRRRALRAAVIAMDALSSALPRRIAQRTPEGYLHYALDPLAYAASAREYVREVGEARAARAVVLGVRSIGTSLSAIVAAVIGSRARTTIRPHGASGARRVRAGVALTRFIASQARRGSDVLVVDVGPGVTGETFEVIVRWLASIGVPLAQQRLFTSHPRDPELASKARVALLRRVRRHAPPAIDPRPERLSSRHGCEIARELSSGAWRAIVRADAPTRGLFERRKILLRDARGEHALLRWAGLGEPAERALRLTTSLSDEGLTIADRPVGEGFALRPWIHATPRRRDDPRDPALFSTLARYLAHRARAARTGRSSERARIVDMLIENTLEHGCDARALSAAVRLVLALPQREATIVDGRLAPWEWLFARDRWLKVDAADHGDGVHLPGPIDLGWDLAGAWIEHRFDAAAMAELARRSAIATRDPWRAHLDAARAYLAPYAAWSLADARLSARVAAPRDRPRLAREIAFYGRALCAALAQASARAPAVTRSFGRAA